ncbi:hypothetical protein R6Q57_001866 [Mikania cordata]
MVKSNRTKPKSLQFKMKQEGAITNNGGGESSFRVLYYGDASAGSVPFMWESHPGTPKQLTTEPSLRPLTPPPAFHQTNQNHNPSNHSTSLRTLFLFTGSRKTLEPDCSSSRQSTSLHSLFLASSSDVSSSLPHSQPTTPMISRQQKTLMKFGMEDGGGGDGSSPCLGGGFMKFCGLKKVKSALKSIIGSHGKIHNY